MTAEQILSTVNGWKIEKRGYMSNLFASKEQLQEIVNSPQASVLQGVEIILILQKEDGFTRVSYFAKSPQAFVEIPDLLPVAGKPYIADIVGRNPKEQSELLCSCGFELYSVFVRMTTKAPAMSRLDGIERVEYAKKEDAPQLHAMICQEFDPLFAHIPSVGQLQEYADKEEILVVRAGKEIAGLAFFEHISLQSIVLRYFVVAPPYRGQNIGGSLLAYEFLRKPDKANYSLWIGTYNKTQTLYQKLGFQYDGLQDYILRYTKGASL